MAAFDPPLSVPFDGARIEDGPFAWVARNASKPGRPGSDAWVAHVRPEHAVRWVDTPKDALVELLLDAFRAVLGVEQIPAWAGAHRWRYARAAAERVDGPRCLYDPGFGIGVCGDWLVGASVEDAWLSGAAVAGRVLAPLERV